MASLGQAQHQASRCTPPPLPLPPPALVGAATECAICLGEFADGDAVRVMPACRHGFHATCIQRWLAGGRRRSSCPTCRAPAAVTNTTAAAGEATNRREPYSDADDDNEKHVAFVILVALQMITLALATLGAAVRYFRGN